MKVKLSREMGFLILWVFVFIVLLIGIIFMLNLLISTETLKKDIDAQIALEDLRATEYDDLIAEFDTLTTGNESEEFSIILPGEEEILQVIQEIESIADTAGGELVKDLGQAELTEEGITVEDPEQVRASGSSDIALKGNGYAIMQIAGTYRTRYDGLLRFLNLLEQSRYFINIDSVNISKVAVEDGPDQIDVRIILNVYVDEIIGL